MIIRLAGIVAVSLVLGNYLPRALVSGRLAWVVWLVSALIVLGTRPLLRRAARSAFGLFRR